MSEQRHISYLKYLRSVFVRLQRFIETDVTLLFPWLKKDLRWRDGQHFDTDELLLGRLT